MAFTFGFYNSIDHDRVYNAEQMSSLFNGIINDGVFQSIGDWFATRPGTGLQVIVGTGRAWFNSTWNDNDIPIALNLEHSDITQKRIDAVVLEVNEAARTNEIKVVTGEPALSPSRPALTNTVAIHQHPLAYVTVNENASEIVSADIQIMVGTTDCPFITAILETTDLTPVYERWEDEFNTWFENVQAQLSGDVVTNLQAQIDQRVKYEDAATKEDIDSGSSTRKFLTPANAKLLGPKDSVTNKQIKMSLKPNYHGKYCFPIKLNSLGDRRLDLLFLGHKKAMFINNFVTSGYYLASLSLPSADKIPPEGFWAKVYNYAVSNYMSTDAFANVYRNVDSDKYTAVSGLYDTRTDTNSRYAPFIYVFEKNYMYRASYTNASAEALCFINETPFFINVRDKKIFTDTSKEVTFPFTDSTFTISPKAFGCTKSHFYVLVCDDATSKIYIYKISLDQNSEINMELVLEKQTPFPNSTKLVINKTFEADEKIYFSVNGYCTSDSKQHYSNLIIFDPFRITLSDIKDITDDSDSFNLSEYGIIGRVKDYVVFFRRDVLCLYDIKTNMYIYKSVTIDPNRPIEKNTSSVVTTLSYDMPNPSPSKLCIHNITEYSGIKDTNFVSLFDCLIDINTGVSYRLFGKIGDIKDSNYAYYGWSSASVPGRRGLFQAGAVLDKDDIYWTCDIDSSRTIFFNHGLDSYDAYYEYADI